MNEYFLISEFAKLRDININSLRYYEKLGLLKPAYVDEKTNYRYYSAEQLTLLNKIIMCVQLGIPLKEMLALIDENGELQSQILLEQGRLAAQKRMVELQNNLKYIETSLKEIEANKKFAGRSGLYYRTFEERKIITTNIYQETLDIENIEHVKKIVSEVAKLYKEAQKREYFPILPAGQILEIDARGTVSVQFFVEVLNCYEEHQNVQILPAGTYSCIQVQIERKQRGKQNLINMIQKHWQMDEPMTIIIDNIMLEKYSFKNSPSELRRLEIAKN